MGKRSSFSRFDAPGLDAFERFEQRAARVPGRFLRAARHHVHAGQRRDRDHFDVLHAELARVGDELSGDGFETRLVVGDAVHLVDRENHVLHAQQRHDVCVAPRLHAHALLRIHQHHRGIGGRGAGGHVARVLLVARAIGDDELAARRLEVAIRHVDGDALLALGLQAVDEQSEIGHFARRAPAAAVVRDGRELVVEHLAGVVQQAADQRALAVVDAAAGDEAQQVDLALLREELFQRAWRLRPGC